MLSKASLVTMDQELAGNPSEATPDLHCLTLQDEIGKMEVNDCLRCKHVYQRFLFLLLFRVREIGSLLLVFQAGFNEQKKQRKSQNQSARAQFLNVSRMKTVGQTTCKEMHRKDWSRPPPFLQCVREGPKACAGTRNFSLRP